MFRSGNARKITPNTPGYIRGRLYPLAKSPYKGPLISEDDVKTLKIDGSPIFYKHEHAQIPVGSIVSHEVEYDKTTSKPWLVIEGLIHEHTEHAIQVMQQIRDGNLSSLSIGYFADGDIDSLCNGTATKTFYEASVCETPMYEGCKIMVKCSEDSDGGQHKLLLLPFNRDSTMTEPTPTNGNSQPAQTAASPAQETQTPAQSANLVELITKGNISAITPESLLQHSPEQVASLAAEIFEAAKSSALQLQQEQARLAEAHARLETLEGYQREQEKKKEEKLNQKFTPAAQVLSSIIEQSGGKKQTVSNITSTLRSNPVVGAAIASLVKQNEDYERQLTQYKNTHNQLKTGGHAPSTNHMTSPAQMLVTASRDSNTSQILGLKRAFETDAPNSRQTKVSRFLASESGALARERVENSPLLQYLQSFGN